MLKKIISILITISMVISFGAINVSATDFPVWYVSAYSGLNCRTAPTTAESNIITTFANGTPLEIVGTDPSGKWWEVWNGAIQGYCYSKFLVNDEDKVVTEKSYDAPSEDMSYIGDFKCTVYDTSPGENGGYSTTACGDNLTDVVGWAIAVDPSVIPYNTEVYIEGVGYRVARDCGGAIKGNKIDILVWDCYTSDGLNGTRKVYKVN